MTSLHAACQVWEDRTEPTSPRIKFLKIWTGDLILRLRVLVHHPLFRLTLIGLAVRLVLAPITQFTYDPVVWYSTGNDMLAGLGPYYTKTYSYPPYWAYTYFPFLLVSTLADPRNLATHVSQMDWISLTLGYSSTILSPLSLMAIKLPLIIGDLATGLLLFRLVKEHFGVHLGRKTYIFWLFNPIVIWTSAIHGTLDVMPAMFTLLALALLLRSNYTQSGISISIAILYKLYAVYLIPLYAILIWTSMGKEPLLQGSLRPKLRRISLFVVGGFLPLVPLSLVSVFDLVHAVSAREAYLSSMGGLSPWMLNYTPGFGWMWNFASDNLAAIQLLTNMLSISISVATGLVLVRHGPINLLGVVKSHVLVISAIYLTLFTVNPQYVLWVIPFLAIMMFAGRMYRKRGLLLTALATAWQLTISGPLVLLPLYYFGLPPQLLTEPIESILITFQPSFNPALLVSGFLGGLITVSFILERQGWLPFGRVCMSAEARISMRAPVGTNSQTRNVSTYLLVAFVIAISLSASLGQALPSDHLIPINTDSVLYGNLLTARSSFFVSTNHLPLVLRIVAAPIASLRTDFPVFIYYDQKFPTLGNDARGWTGVLDHLPAELRLRGYLGRIQTVDASGLQKAMVQDPQSVIVVPSGVFPSTVQNATESLVRPWLRSGGVLVWMGGPFGFYSTPLARTLDPLTTNMSTAIAAQENILGYRLTEPPLLGPSRIATISTTFSTALSLSYSDVWVAPTIGLLSSIGGLNVGFVQSETNVSRSSLSIIPVGAGKIILFGGPVSNVLTADGEDIVAHDTAQILSLDDVLFNAGIKSATFTIPPAESTWLSFSASFNSTSAVGVILMGFSDYSFSRLFWKTEVPVRVA